MARKRRSSTPTAGAQIPKKGQIAARIPDIAEILSKADALLQAGAPKKALDLIARARMNSPWLTNALAVCQLRLGNTAVAVDVFRGLVLGCHRAN